MALPLVTPFLPEVLVAVGAVVAALALRALLQRARDRRYGTLVSADDGTGGGRTLAAPRYRLSGRPDILRRAASGATIPIELKHRPSFERGPPYSHVVQVWAYCLLVEETTGIPPPYGVLRYSDGVEMAVTWDGDARRELLGIRAALARPYDGRARPSVARCARCPWRLACDARAVPA